MKLNYRGPRSGLAPRRGAEAHRRRRSRSTASKYRLAWGGQFENQQRARGAPRADPRRSCSALILLLLYAAFGIAAAGGADPRHRAAGDARRADRAASARHDAQRRSGVGFIALFGVAVHERRHHGGEPQPRARPRRAAARGGAGRRGRAAAAGADDGDGRDRRHAAGGARDRRRQRRAAQPRDRRRRRARPGDAADAVHHPDALFRARAPRRRGGPRGARPTAGKYRSCRRMAGQGRAWRDDDGEPLDGVAALALAALLAGCAVGPDFVHAAGARRDAAIRPSRWRRAPHRRRRRAAQAQRFVRDLDLPGQWWTLFHSRPLNALVERALANNPDLQAAQAALRVARENVYAQQGRAVSAGRRQLHRHPAAAADRGAGRSTIPTVAPTFNLFTGQLNVSYSPDVFGGTRRSIESAGGAGGCPALPARSDLSDADLEHRGRRRAGSLAARPDRGDAADHQDRARRARSAAATARARPDRRGSTSWRRRRRWRRSSRPCRRCRSSWRSSATCWRRWPAASRATGLSQTVRAGGAAAAARPAGQPAVASWSSSVPTSGRRSQPACRRRPDRRRHRQPAAQHHADRRRPAARRSRSTSCSRPAPASGARRRRDAADLPRRHAVAPRARRQGGLRPGGGAVPQHGHHGVPERRRRAARDPVRCGRAAEGGRVRARGGQEPRHRARRACSSAISTISACSPRSRPISRP